MKKNCGNEYLIPKNEWVKEPKREKLAKAKVNKSLIRSKVAKYADEIDALVSGKTLTFGTKKVEEEAAEEKAEEKPAEAEVAAEPVAEEAKEEVAE